jgi:hypothetical protein
MKGFGKMGKLDRSKSLKPSKKPRKKGFLKRFEELLNDFLSIEDKENPEKIHNETFFNDIDFTNSNFNDENTYEEYLENEFLRNYKEDQNFQRKIKPTKRKYNLINENEKNPKNLKRRYLKNPREGLKENLDINSLKAKNKPKTLRESLLSMINEYEKSGHFGFDLKKGEKKIMGILIFTLIIFLVVGGSYYYLVFQPMNEEIENEKIAKIDEINSLFKGPLADAKEREVLEDRINNCHTKYEVESVDVLRPATALWKDYHYKSINESKDAGNRVMISYDNNTHKNGLITVNDSIKIVKDNDGNVLSNIKFKKPDTVAVPIKVSRLQAGNGLIKTGSQIDIYSINSSDNSNTNEDNESYIENNNRSQNTNGESNNESTSNNDNLLEDNMKLMDDEKLSEKDPDISGCTVLAIMRSKDSGTISEKEEKLESLQSNKNNISTEETYSYSEDVEESLKAEAIEEYSDVQTENILNNYGIRLSDYERVSNIGELDTEYLILLEVPREDVQFTLNNMDNLVLTIPTKDGPSWMIEEIKQTNNQ